MVISIKPEVLFFSPVYYWFWGIALPELRKYRPSDADNLGVGEIMTMTLKISVSFFVIPRGELCQARKYFV